MCKPTSSFRSKERVEETSRAPGLSGVFPSLHVILSILLDSDPSLPSVQTPPRWLLVLAWQSLLNAMVPPSQHVCPRPALIKTSSRKDLSALCRHVGQQLGPLQHCSPRDWGGGDQTDSGAQDSGLWHIPTSQVSRCLGSQNPDLSVQHS